MNDEFLEAYIRCQKDRSELMIKIDKAIEYIEHAQNYGTMAQVMPHLKPYVNGDDVLDILKGSDNDDKENN